MPPPYRCIHCAAHLNELCYFFSKEVRVLKLASCPTCSRIADEYIEYDPVIVGIDAALQKPEAYRHLFFNATLETPWRWAIVLSVIYALVPWFLWSTSVGSGTNMWVLEKGFYLIMLQSLAEIALFSVLCTALVWWCCMRKRHSDLRSDFRLPILFNALIISSWPFVAEVASVIWSDSNNDAGITLIFRTFAFLCHTQAFAVLTERRFLATLPIVGWCYLVVALVRIFLNLTIQLPH